MIKTDIADAYPENAFYRWYVVVILLAVFILNIADRHVLSVLQQSIKEELVLTDTQLGLLSGFAFTVFYAIAGIPLARLADRGNRRNLIAIALLLFSAMTALSGRAQTYIHLLLARIGVGIGEACCSPSSASIISDLFPQDKRATPMAIYSLGLMLGTAVGFGLGGAIASEYNWRVAFLALGVPGIFLSLLLRATVSEPQRERPEDNSKIECGLSFKMAYIEMLENRTLVRMILGTSILTAVFISMGTWITPFLERSWDMDVGEAGRWVALSASLGGLSGTLAGGILSDKLGRIDKRWFMWLQGYSGLIAMPLLIACFTIDSKSIMIMLMGAMFFVSTIGYPISMAMGTTLVRNDIRALTIATILFLINVVGAAGGTLLTGFLSDLLSSYYDLHSLRYALCVVSLLCIPGFLLFLNACKTVELDIEKANSPR